MVDRHLGARFDRCSRRLRAFWRLRDALWLCHDAIEALNFEVAAAERVLHQDPYPSRRFECQVHAEATMPSNPDRASQSRTSLYIRLP